MTELQIQQVQLDAIEPSPHNPRSFRKNDPELASLAQSIREKGVLSPVLVRPRDVNGDNNAGRYVLIAGERRWRASKLAERETIPVIVRTDLTDQEALELTVTENLQREDLHPLEEAKGVASLLGAGETIAQVADRLGKPLSWVARRARLTKLSPSWRKLANDPESSVGFWSASALEIVARLEPAAQDEYLGRVDNYRLENMSFEQLRRELAGFTRELRLAPWKLDDATLVPKAGACSECPKRSSCNPGLFDDEPAEGKKALGDRCLDATCWKAKADVMLEQKYFDLSSKHPRLLLGGQAHWPVPEFAKGKSLVNSWEGDKVPKGHAEAVPVLVVNGDDAGKVEWRRFEKRSSAAAKTAKAAGAAPKTKSLAERRKALELRRRAHSLKEICNWVRGRSSIATPSVDVVVQLAAAYGTHSKRERPDSGSIKPVEDQTAALRSLWQEVADVISRRWELFHRWQGLAGLAKVAPEMERVAPMIGLELAPFAAAAEMAIPEPKSWAKLTEKGAPKKAKPDKVARPAKAVRAAAPTKRSKKREPAGVGGSKCRVCGCSDYDACEGGCHWVESDLCSACVGGQS